MNATAVFPWSIGGERRVAFRPTVWVPAAQLAVDLVALETALLLGTLLRLALNPWFSVALAPPHVQGIALGLLVAPLSYLLLGLYPGYGLSPVERLRRRVQANAFVFFGFIAWGYLVHRERWSRGVLLLTLLLALLVSPIAERILISLLHRVGLWGTSVVVFGTRHYGEAIAERLNALPALGYVPVAVVEVEAHTAWTGKALAAVANLHLRAAGLEPARVAVVAMPALEDDHRRELLEALPFRCVIVMSSISQIQTQSITTVDIGGALGLALNRNLLVPWNRWLKRTFDIVAASLLLAISAPLIAICALLIRLTNAGPAFYSQQRVGHLSRPIRVWKLRTMYLAADQVLERYLDRNPAARLEWQQHFKLRHDPRVLPGIGRFLRRSSLDELPQLWNVLVGDMSLVGPRPFPQYHLASFDARFLHLRECVRPGLTGLWQVSARADGDLSAQQALDSYYIRNWSLWLDIEVALRTLGAVIRGNGAY